MIRFAADATCKRRVPLSIKIGSVLQAQQIG